MDAILALDTGGTKCDALLLSTEGQILGYARCTQPGFGGRHSFTVNRAIKQTTNGLSHEFGTLYVTTLGVLVPLTGFQNIKVDRFELVPASEWATALVHAGFEHGVVVLAGTGAFVQASLPDGRFRYLDGGGPLLGDFGSGFHIGFLALQAAFRADWHARHATSLRDRILTFFEVKCPYDLIRLELFNSDRSLVASLARLVIEEATAGDNVAQQIIEEATGALAATFGDLVTSLGIEQERHQLVGIGGLIQNAPVYRAALWAQLRQSAPFFELTYLESLPVISLAVYTLRHISGADSDKAVEYLCAQAAAQTAAAGIFDQEERQLS